MRVSVSVTKRQYGSVTIEIPNDVMKCSDLAQKRRVQKAAMVAVAEDPEIIQWYDYGKGTIAFDFGFFVEEDEGK